MMTLHLRNLIEKLSTTTRRGLEGAVGLCVSRTHYQVELEHWFLVLAESESSDIARMLRHCGIEPAQFLRDLSRGLEDLRTGNGGRPELSEHIENVTQEAWLLASINYGLPRIRSGVVFLACLSDRRRLRRLSRSCPALASVNVESLGRVLPDLIADSSETRETGEGRGATDPAEADAIRGPTPALDQFTVDMTAAAQAGHIDPVRGRDAEIRQIIDILTRKRQNNPILTGEAGVGKTAVVEGLALRISAGDVPEPLKQVILRRLDLGLLQAGAGVRGEFEDRVRRVLEEVTASPRPIILFIDEAHTLIGAGGPEGGTDAANLLKPALARGELRTVAATTWAEYKKYFEKDPALSRRFQVVRIDEPSETNAIAMMRGVVASLEAHHGVRVLDEAVVESVRLSHRYIPARQLPDKCMSVLDTACARVAMAQVATPAAIEDLRRRIEDLDHEEELLARERACNGLHADRLTEIDASRAETCARLTQLENRWQAERVLVARIDESRRSLESLPSPDNQEDPESTAGPIRAALRELREDLAKLQGETPLVSVEVDAGVVAQVISGWTGIPVGKMESDEIHSVLNLAQRLGRRVLGQDAALETIARRIQSSRARLDNPARPQGVFLLFGPSGVGKTETALTIADTLYGQESNAIIVNLSEYQESHSVAGLRGSPPGYVGYGEGGVLTEAVRRRPYSVVLLDEVEKAHRDVLELFLQVFDRGTLEDGQGRKVDFRNTVILLGSNVGSDRILSLCTNGSRPSPDEIVEAARPDLLRAFPAALLGRTVPVPYYPLTAETLMEVVRLQLERIADRVRREHNARLCFTDRLIAAVVRRADDPTSGARVVDRVLTHSLLPRISIDLLTRMAREESFSRIEIDVDDAGEFTLDVS